jgi:hypothetical protein
VIFTLVLNIRADADPPTASVSVEKDGQHLGTREDISPKDWGGVLGAVSTAAGPEVGGAVKSAMKAEVVRVMTEIQAKITEETQHNKDRQATLLAFQQAAALLQ